MLTTVINLVAGLGLRLSPPSVTERCGRNLATYHHVVRSAGRQGPAEVSFSEDQHAVGEFGKQFARGHRGGILMTSMPASANTALNKAANCSARSRTRNRNAGDGVGVGEGQSLSTLCATGYISAVPAEPASTSFASCMTSFSSGTPSGGAQTGGSTADFQRLQEARQLLDGVRS